MSDLTDITDNIESVLSTTLSYKLEDLSSVNINDADWDDTVLCQLLFLGLERLDTMGEKPKRSWANFAIMLQFRDTSPDLSRSRSQDIHDSLWGNLTADDIDLTAKNVERVEHLESVVDYEPPLTKITYPIRVRYGYTSN